MMSSRFPYLSYVLVFCSLAFDFFPVGRFKLPTRKDLVGSQTL